MALGWSWPVYTKVKFGHIGFCMGKSKTCLFFGNHCSLGSQSCLKHLAKWVNEVERVSKVKVILWPWSKVTQISMVKLVFLKNSLAIWNQSAYESLRENRNENLYKWIGSHDQHGRHAHTGNHCSLGSQSCLKHLAKWVNELSEYRRSRSFFDLDQRSLRFQW